MDDHITKALQDLKAELPQCQVLDEKDKDLLIKTLGIKTTLNILNAQKTYPQKRIPFLFSSLDTQMVINALGNDLSDALKRAQRSK